jgi:hypothetical protein
MQSVCGQSAGRSGLRLQHDMGSQREESHVAGQLAWDSINVRHAAQEACRHTPPSMPREKADVVRIVNVANTTYTPQHTLVSPYPAKCSPRLIGSQLHVKGGIGNTKQIANSLLSPVARRRKSTEMRGPRTTKSEQESISSRIHLCKSMIPRDVTSNKQSDTVPSSVLTRIKKDEQTRLCAAFNRSR